MDFALSVKEKPKTDEWYTPRSSIEPIIPYAKGKVGVRLIPKKAITLNVCKNMGLSANTRISIMA